ncbi:MAG: hypothetical protein SH857_14205 [Chitinophagales bacterium]|nr:hypothetical protein [Chitinophagales bacterium]
MKTKKWLLVLTTLSFSVFLNGCKDDSPDPVNEEELITTLRLTFTPTAGSPVVLQYQDLDGDAGGNPPVLTGDTLNANTAYAVVVEVLNESVDPADNITEEVEEEGEEHQFFFQFSSALNLSFTYSDLDAGGYPIGLASSAQAGAASMGTLTVTLRHEPNKHATGVEDGDMTNAGGETDIEVTFDVVIQ